MGSATETHEHEIYYGRIGLGEEGDYDTLFAVRLEDVDRFRKLVVPVVDGFFASNKLDALEYLADTVVTECQAGAAVTLACPVTPHNYWESRSGHEHVVVYGAWWFGLHDPHQSFILHRGWESDIIEYMDASGAALATMLDLYDESIEQMLFGTDDNKGVTA